MVDVSDVLGIENTYFYYTNAWLKMLLQIQMPWQMVKYEGSMLYILKGLKK